MDYAIWIPEGILYFHCMNHLKLSFSRRTHSLFAVGPEDSIGATCSVRAPLIIVRQTLEHDYRVYIFLHEYKYTTAEIIQKCPL